MLSLLPGAFHKAVLQVDVQECVMSIEAHTHSYFCLQSFPPYLSLLR